MGILSRFKDIIAANINDALDKTEDPEKMCNQYILEMTEDLAEVKKETAEVIAEEKRCRKLVEENEAEIAKYLDLAKQALEAGNEGDAKIFLQKKQQIEASGEGMRIAYKAAAQNADKMRQLHDKLTNDIQLLQARREAIKAKMSVARTQETVNKYAAATGKYDDAMDAFSKMEEKAEERLDNAVAMYELNTAANSLDEAERLEAKYAAGSSQSVDDELEALKAAMGL